MPLMPTLQPRSLLLQVTLNMWKRLIEGPWGDYIAQFTPFPFPALGGHRLGQTTFIPHSLLLGSSIHLHSRPLRFLWSPPHGWDLSSSPLLSSPFPSSPPLLHSSSTLTSHAYRNAWWEMWLRWGRTWRRCNGTQDHFVSDDDRLSSMSSKAKVAHIIHCIAKQIYAFNIIHLIINIVLILIKNFKLPSVLIWNYCMMSCLQLWQ